MTINFNVEPYHDDFDENKKFVRILFRPGYAVQARELTQLQTIIQKQIERQGNHLFKDGAMVIPGQISFDKEYNYVRLLATNNTIQTDSIIDSFVGKDVIGSITGISARVVNVTRGSANSGVPLLHVKYNTSGDDNVTQVFAANETLTIITEEQQSQLSVKTVASAATGVGSAVSIQAGVYYVKGYFIYVEEQTVVLQYNSTTPSYRVGLQITESIVTPEEDETLLDNAQNSYNYTAPGAHRYAIYLTLVKKGINTTDDTDFIELLRVQSGRIQRIVDRTEYAELEKTLARRTYDESGNYTVTPFGIQVREYRNNSRGAWTRNTIYLYGDVVSYYNASTKKTEYFTCRESGTSTANTNVTTPASDDLQWELTPAPVYNRGVNVPALTVDELQEDGTYQTRPAVLSDHEVWESKLAVGMEPGKAYVYGYEIQKQSIDYVTVDKARTTDSREGLLISADMGNYVVVRNINRFPDISQLEQVKIFSSPRVVNVSGTISGTTLTVPSTSGLVEGMELSKISGTGVFGASAKIDSITSDTTLTMTIAGATNGAVVFNAVISGVEVGTARVRGFEFHAAGDTPEENQYKMFLFDINMYYYDVELKKKYSFIHSAKHFTTDSVSPDETTFSANTVLDTEQKTGSVKVSGTFVYGTLTKFKTEFSVGDWIYVNDRLRKISAISNDFNMTVHWSAGNSGDNNYLPIYSAVRPLYGAEAPSLLFPLPNYAITNVNKATYSTVKYFDNETVTDSTVTLVASVGEQFVSASDPGNYILFSQGTGEQVTYTGFTLGSSNSTITFTGVSAVDGTLVTCIATVYKSVNAQTVGSICKLKELVETTYTVTNESRAKSQQIFLGKSDGVKLKSVLMKNGTFASPGTKTTDVTSRYTFNNGQTDSYYGPCSISLKNGQPAPSGQLVVTFQYYNHTNLGRDFFTADSYPDYKAIPKYKNIELRDCLDFRPRLGDNSYDGSLTIPADAEVLPKFGEEFSITYDYYLSRKTNIFLSKNGTFVTTDSAADLSPKEPEAKTEAMLVYRLHLEPYTFTTATTSVDVKFVDNKRYTMRDIGRLENRINNLEYYTSLSLLEQQTKSLTITDVDGFDRFKSGFVVDNFTGHVVGDAENPDYICSMDFDEGSLRPFYTMENVNFVEVLQNAASRASKNYRLTGDLITLPYTDTSLVNQPFCSRVENINPFAIFTFIGNMDLTPAVDNWFEVKRRPDIIVPVEGNYSTIKSLAEKAGVLGTVWNAWQTQWTGRSTSTTTTQTLRQGGGWPVRQITTEVTATQVGQSRTGIKSTIQEKIEYKTVDDKVLSVAVIPYIRSRQILVQAKGLKPKTQFFPFFDKVNVNAYCTPAARIVVNTIKNSTGGNATVDAFDTDENVGNDYKEAARSLGPNPEFSLNVGDVVYVSKRGATTYTYNNSTVTAVVVGKEYAITGAVSAIYVVNVKDSVVTDGIGFNVGDTITGTVSGVSANVVSYTAATKGGNLITNLNGDVNFLYEIPNTDALRFRTGNRELALFDTATYPALLTGTRAIKTYSAEGRLETRQATVQAIRNAEIVQEVVSENRTITDTSSRIVSDTGWYDPLAQTFLVDCEGGCFLTKIDLYFATKDTEKPAIVQIREVVNGYPGRAILPFSEVVLKPEQVNADVNGRTATVAKFKSPVFVEHNKEYAICLISNSNNYNVWISQLGEKNKGTDQFISEQPYAGVLFKSQNASTWTAEQMQDLKFTIYRAKFDTNKIATVDFENEVLKDVELENNPFQFTAGSNKVRVYHQDHGLVASTLTNGERSSIVQFRKVGDTMTGTIKPSSTSTTLVGVGTNFDAEVEVGAAIYRSDNAYIGTVASIQSDTSLTLTANPTMTNTTGIAYKVVNPFNGVKASDIFDKKFVVSNVELDSYVITLDPSVNPTETTVSGGSNVFSTREVPYDYIQPSIATQTFPKTQTNYSFRGIRSKSVDGSQVPYDFVTSFVPVTLGDINPMPVPMSIASDLNVVYQVNSSGSIVTRATPINLSTQSTTVRNSAVMRLQFVSEVDNLSPVYDTRSLSVIAISNKINNPSATMNVPELDDRQIVTGLQEGTDVVLTSGTVSKLDFTGAGVDDRNFVKTLRSGQYITISGSKATANNKTWLLTDVDPDGDFVYVSGAIITTGTDTAGDNFTITSKDRFFSEITPVGSSAYSKYVTKKINFSTPSTSLKIMMAAYVPSRANVDVYYKISKVEDYEDFEYVEWILASSSTTFTKTDKVDDFVDAEIDVEGLPQFNAMSVKLVFRSTDSTQVPVIKDLRIIACA